MATATMAWEARKAAACGCIGRAEAPRRPPEWRRSRCCTVVHSIGAPDLVCSGIRGLCGCHPEPNLPGRGPPPCPPPLSLTARRLAAGLQQLDPAAEQAAPLAICILEEQKDLGGRWDLGVEERLHRLENGLETYKVLFEPSDLVPVAWIMSYQHVSQKRLAVRYQAGNISILLKEKGHFYRVKKKLHGAGHDCIDAGFKFPRILNFHIFSN